LKKSNHHTYRSITGIETFVKGGIKAPVFLQIENLSWGIASYKLPVGFNRLKKRGIWLLYQLRISCGYFYVSVTFFKKI